MTVYHPRCYVMLSVVLDGRGAGDSDPLLIETVPMSATVSRNGYHEANSWSVDYDARLTPIDPDLIRSMEVAIFMFGADGATDDRDWAVPAYEMVRGLADEPSITLDRSGQRIHVEGRDYTGLLLDEEWDPRDRIPAGKPLDETVQAIADAAAPPGARLRFEVVFDSLDSDPPIVGASRRSTKKKGLWVKPGKTYWDVIYEMAIQEGFIAYVKGPQIIVTDPRTQTRASLAEAPRLAYGRDLESLRFTRRLAKERVPQIEVVCHDNRTGKPIRVRYPASHDSAPTTSLGTVKDERQRVVIRSGVRDEATLRRIARTRYDNLGRCEATYEWETRHLRSLNNLDLFGLDAGTPIYLQFDPFNAEQMRALSSGQRVEHLLAMGYSARVAQFVAKHYDRMDVFRQPHYQREVTYSWDGSSMAISGKAVNYAYEPRELQEAI